MKIAFHYYPNLRSSQMGKRTLIGVLASALALGPQHLAWATCSDGTTFPAGGYIVGQPPISDPANWSKNVFTGTLGSVFIPDNSYVEHNDIRQPLTGGGHNWAFDQGSTLCKETDTGPAGATATAWSIPPNNPTECVILPIVKGGTFTNLGDIPGRGDVITPTCNPDVLGTNANSYFNQLGCRLSGGTRTTPDTASSFLFVPGIKGGLFSIRLDNAGVTGGNAGKTVALLNYYSAIPEGQKLTNAAVSPDGQFAIATSNKRAQYVYACLNPLGDPGDPTKPFNTTTFVVPPAATVKCMQVGNNGLAVDLTTTFGPDNQPYFGGQRFVTTFNTQPGGASPSAWPDCIWRNNGSTSLTDAFTNKRSNGCGNAVVNSGFLSAAVTQPQALTTHGQYMYVSPVGGTIVQLKVTKNAFSGLSEYSFRTYVSGLSINTGIGVADDLQSLMVFSDPSGIGAAGQEVVTKLPLCEDM